LGSDWCKGELIKETTFMIKKRLDMRRVILEWKEFLLERDKGSE
jgi:hypothetical protein